MCRVPTFSCFPALRFFCAAVLLPLPTFLRTHTYPTVALAECGFCRHFKSAKQACYAIALKQHAMMAYMVTAALRGGFVK
jgi:hypothetical protein